MALKQEKDLSDQLRSYWLKAVTAIELHNFGYAIELLQNVLKQEPGFLTGRQMLRRAEVTRAKTEKKGFFNISTTPIAVMKAQRELKKDPHRTIELVEKVLTGATPVLAPGSMALLGLIGLTHSYRHPAIHGGAEAPPNEEDDP